MKVFVLTSKQIDEFQLGVINRLLSSKHKILGWIVDDREPKSKIQKAKSNLKKGRGGYIIIMGLKLLFKRNQTPIDISALMQKTSAPIYYTKNLNSSENINAILTFNPDALILLGGFGIIKNEVLNLCKYGVIAYHHGDMNKYRGQPPGFWELYNNESELGVTVQKLSAGLDCGEPIMEITIPIKYKDTLHSLQKRMFTQSIDMLANSLDFLEDKKPVLKKLDIYGKIYTLPNLRQWLLFNIKIVFRYLKYLNKTEN